MKCVMFRAVWRREWRNGKRAYMANVIMILWVSEWVLWEFCAWMCVCEWAVSPTPAGTVAKNIRNIFIYWESILRRVMHRDISITSSFLVEENPFALDASLWYVMWWKIHCSRTMWSPCVVCKKIAAWHSLVHSHRTRCWGHFLVALYYFNK